MIDGFRKNFIIFFLIIRMSDSADIKNDPYTEIVNDLISIYQKRVIDVTTVIDLVTDLMQGVEKYKGLTGETKKNIVMDVIKFIAVSSGADSNVVWFIQFTLPYIIDVIVAASRSQLALNLNDKAYKFCCEWRSKEEKKQIIVNSLTKKPIIQ